MESADAEGVEQSPLGVGPIRDGDWREVRPPRFAVGTLARRAAGTVTRPRNVHADDVVLVRVDGLARPDDVGPPRACLSGDARFGSVARDVLAAGETVADDDRVFARELAVGLVGHVQIRNVFARLELVFAEVDNSRFDLSPNWRPCSTHWSSPSSSAAPSSTTPSCACWFSAHSIAWSRSAMMSSASSIPTERRSMSGATPAARCSSIESWAWVVDAG
ncbi:hypothetical protein HFX_3013 [Haloferax mediterranei ATCC 33500]|uniref:Uncharacterized protein n=1 Tax=Haloferax mediterranei (strain ATCC 33500 / DSM 1411 / JCM 8866 / NBRC 14739 / NCIMB 2177 / R-4) TaxID=523841 RepID=I3R8W8_HALMT|nr:hypothetical protein HFX_3013 [Haloferax mediterranei ATCC 33500]